MSGDLDLDRLAGDVLAAVEARSAGAKPSRGEQRFLCPCHDDHKPSARYHAEKRSWFCDPCGFGGGIYAGEHALAPLLDIDLEAYRQPDPKAARRNGHAKPKASEASAFDAPPDLGPAKVVDWSKFTAFYDWRDSDGVLRFRVARKADKSFPTFQPAADGERWHSKMTGVRPLLYHADELARLEAGSEVWVGEGEKDADNLRAAGFDATTFPGWCRDRWTEASGPLAGQHVIVVADHDDAGRGKATEAATAAHWAGAASVRVLDFAAALGENGQPAMLPGGFDASDFLAEHDGGELRRLGRAAPEVPPPPAPRRAVETKNRQLDAVGDDALDVLRELNEASPVPVVFRRGLGLAHVQPDDDGRPVIVEHGSESIRALLAQGAYWTRTTIRESGPRVDNTDPPLAVVQYVHGVRDWPLYPVLRALTTAPVLTAQGRILCRPGYDEASGIVYVGDPFDLPEEPPTDAEVEAARSLIIDDLLGDFPFVNDASRAHAVAYAVLPFVRHAIRGPVACFLADAPAARTGKTLLVEVLAWLFVGGPVPLATPKREDELGKWILAKLVQGSTHAVIDNLPSKLDSAALASTITGTEHDGRILGKTLAVTVPNRTTWALTGNNVTMTEELAGRAYWCRLDTELEFPGDRDPTVFRHADLKGWTAAHRTELVAAVMTFVRAWLAAGRPSGSGRPLAGFEAWSRTIGGILEGGGVTGFLDNARDLWETADPEAQAWRAFVEAWADAHGSTSTTAADLVDLAGKAGVIDPDGKSPARALGNGLGFRRDRVIAGWRIRHGGKSKHGVTWNLAEPPGQRSHASAALETEVGYSGWITRLDGTSTWYYIIGHDWETYDPEVAPEPPIDATVAYDALMRRSLAGHVASALATLRAGATVEVFLDCDR